jgi:hypothetical protein
MGSIADNTSLGLSDELLELVVGQSVSWWGRSLSLPPLWLDGDDQPQILQRMFLPNLLKDISSASGGSIF